ncbi:MAG: YraN family protein [Chitinispirillaceae bacterium]
MNSREKGNYGENKAAQHLISQGYTIESRNYATRMGEIDIVARSPEGVLVFVEVKSSGGFSCGNPLYWITPAKQKNLLRIAKRFMYEHGIFNQPCRMDVISVVRGKVDHIRNAFLV